ncbi:oligosaccharide flippase family protein [Cyanobacteria bacterium FACHB-63]|nr:oligosaccharide flippase family protein [Cyanobacteria bacterium FACHB-63]
MLNQSSLIKGLRKVKTIALRNSMAKRAAGSFVVKVILLGIAFITNVCLARVLGASGYGDYIYAITWVGFLGVLACLGLPEYLVREVAVYQAKSDWGALKRSLRRSDEMVLLWIAIGAIAAVTAWWVNRADFERLVVFWLCLFSLPFGTLTALRQGRLNALLIPNLGLEGAAIATATSIMRETIFSVRTYQTLKIIPNPFRSSLQQ